ncbi:hypothetical protein KIL84_013335 [Mauremys mutica]|uniref:Uncharacterized protein n=1 Tax=Mauremys mutica TaxID=74926 RepID=A0A9D3WXI1_9SAUR|nr:hypothetical protein KIL84_013335 [Mauremys mutica]
MFNEILQGRAASDHKHRAWRMNTGDSLEKEKVERRKVQEKEREMNQDIMELLRQQTQMLVYLQSQHSQVRLPLQLIENSTFHIHQGPLHYPCHSSPVGC